MRPHHPTLSAADDSINWSILLKSRLIVCYQCSTGDFSQPDIVRRGRQSSILKCPGFSGPRRPSRDTPRAAMTARMAEPMAAPSGYDPVCGTGTTDPICHSPIRTRSRVSDHLHKRIAKRNEYWQKLQHSKLYTIMLIILSPRESSPWYP